MLEIKNRDLTVDWLHQDRHPDWDDFVATSNHGSVYHRMAWSRAVSSVLPKSELRILAFTDPQTGQIRGGLPTYRVNSWLTGVRLLSAPFATFCDPIWPEEGIESGLIGTFGKLLDSSGIHIVVRCRSLQPTLETSGMECHLPFKHHVLRIHGSSDEIWYRFSRTAIRRVIRKAQESGLVASRAENLEDLGSFHALLTDRRRKMGLPVLPKEFFATLLAQLEPMAWALYSARLGDRVVASLLTLRDRKRTILEYVAEALDWTGRGACSLLYWTAIQDAMQLGHSEVSFGRTIAGDDGLRMFKSHWDTDESDLPVYVYPSKRTAHATSERGSLPHRVATWCLSRSTHPIYRYLSNFCCRHGP